MIRKGSLGGMGRSLVGAVGLAIMGLGGCAAPADDPACVTACDGAGPALATVSPPRGPTTGGVTLTLAGGGFQAGATVRIGGQEATEVTRRSAGELTVTLPASLGQAGRVDVVVQNPDGRQAAAAGAFTYHFGQVEFATPRHYDTIAGPSSIVTADFDGDGELDLATSNLGRDGIAVMRGRGDGSFTMVSEYVTGAEPVHLAAGDLDGDGRLDLAVTNRAGDTVTVLRNRGDGTFGAGQSYETGREPLWVAIGDINGDGAADLVVGAYSVDVYLGKGDGTFTARAEHLIAGTPWGIALGDFDGDRRQDVAVSRSAESDVAIMLGKGDGTFQGARGYDASINPWPLVAADLNGDGALDLVLSGGSSNIAVVLGKGDGSFGAPKIYKAGADATKPLGVVLADLDGDGALDAVTALYEGRGASVLRGDGKGGFLPPTFYRAEVSPHGVAAGDFDGDGRVDFAVTNLNSASVSVFLNSSM